MSHSEITALAAAEPTDCHGVTFLPYLLGERTPNWPQATGALLGALLPAASAWVGFWLRKGKDASSTTPCWVHAPEPPPLTAAAPAAAPHTRGCAGLRPGLARAGLLYRAAMQVREQGVERGWQACAPHQTLL